MSSPSATFLVHGTDTPSPVPKPLWAGPLTLDYDHGDLRSVRLGEREILRRICGAVRDQNWGTVPGILSEERIEVSGSTFRITYTSTHRQKNVHFVWHAEVEGEADGTLRFGFDGEARSTFLRNRIGLCVLHPIRECAGARTRATRIDGTSRELEFPKIVAAEQPVTGFDSLAELAHEIVPGIWARVCFEGEVFETEDQRNWIDASFKTYGTTLRLPFPVEVKAGARIRQRVTVKLVGAGVSGISRHFARDVRAPVSQEIVTIELANEVCRLPEIGLCASGEEQPFSETEGARMAALNLGHLRTDVKLDDSTWGLRLRSAARSATALGLPLELAVHLPPDGDPRELPALRRELTRVRADVSRVLAFQDGEGSSTTAVVASVREHLGDLEVPIGAGSNADLYQLNLRRPPSHADFICWSMNPQVHAGDSRSLMETPEAAAAQVASVKCYVPGAPLVISPITMRPRFNPNATDAEAEASLSADRSPIQVDPRQMSLVGASWTVAMLAALAPAEVESLTFYEMIGWLGVMETAQGSRSPETFPSFASGVFPMWHVFAALNGFRSVVVVTVGDPRRVAAFAVTNRVGRRRVLLANLTPGAVDVSIAQVRGTVRVLDEFTVSDSMREPEAWWRRPAVPSGERLQLSAFAVAFVDVT